MSLQGSLDTVGLADVLTLLASTAKSGELEVSGDRRSGRLWFAEGKLNGFAVGKAPRPVDAVFELLRVTTGAFVFNDKRMAPSPQAPVAVDQVVSEAKARLSEWRTIEAVVPSLDARVELTPDPPAGVTLTRDQWQLVVAIGDGRPVGAVLERRQVGEFDGCKAIKGMVDARLAKVVSRSEAAAKPEPAVSRESTPARVPAAAGERPTPVTGERSGKLTSMAAEVASVLGRPSNGNGGSIPRPVPAQPGPVSNQAPVGDKAPSDTAPGKPEAAAGARTVAGDKPVTDGKAAATDTAAAGAQAAAGDKAPAGGRSPVVARPPAVRASQEDPAAGGSPVNGQQAKPLNGSQVTPAPAAVSGQPAVPAKTGSERNGAAGSSNGHGQQAPAAQQDSSSSPAGKAAGDGPDAEQGAPRGEEIEGEEDEPLNRGLLLKFLSSVRS